MTKTFAVGEDTTPRKVHPGPTAISDLYLHRAGVDLPYLDAEKMWHGLSHFERLNIMTAHRTLPPSHRPPVLTVQSG